MVDPGEKDKVVAWSIGFDIGAMDGDIELSDDSREEGFSIDGVEGVEEGVECIVERPGREGSVLRDEEFKDDCDIQMSRIYKNISSCNRNDAKVASCRLKTTLRESSYLEGWYLCLECTERYDQ